jgi:vitamin K-dependent gamma-carboxylase
MNRLVAYLFREVDIAPLALFRVAFGFLIFAEAAGALASGWVKRVLVDPEITFPLVGFELLQPLPGNGMYVWFAVMAAAGLFVMVGLFYRAAMLVYGALWTCVYLMQSTHYNNHYYLLVLMCAFMLLVPADRYLSIDARRIPGYARGRVPQWCLTIFVVQMAIVYTYAAINKLYPDWLSGQTIGVFFSGRTHFWLIGPLLANDTFQLLVSWGGVLFDGLIVPMMLWRRTRMLGMAAMLVFHLFNSAVFHIGIFPYMMIAMAVFFFPPEQVSRVLLKSKTRRLPPLEMPSSPRLRRALVMTLACYFAIQVLLPLRHHLYDSNVNWTEEGHRLSWRMMLRGKRGYVDFHIREVASGATYVAPEQDMLSPGQHRRMAGNPRVAWRFAQYLAKLYRERDGIEIEVYAHGKVSLNGHTPQTMIDPERDLVTAPYRFWRSSDWILPFDPAAER